MLQFMVVKLLARELALADFVLVLARRNAVFLDGVTVAIFHGLRDVLCVFSCAAVARFVVVWTGGRGLRRGGGSGGCCC
jgi:hypothetical protein